MLNSLLKIILRTNIVRDNPKNQTTPDLKNFDNFFICILSDIPDTIPREVETKISGIRIEDIIFPVNVIIIKSRGWMVLAVTIFPVVTIRAISIGSKEFKKPTKLFTVSFIIPNDISKVCHY